MKFSKTVGLLALGTSFVAALPKAQDPDTGVVDLPVDDGGAVVDLDPFADDPTFEDDPFADPIPEDPPVDDAPIEEVGGPTGIPTDDPTGEDVDDNAGIVIIQDPIPAECADGCPEGYVLGNYYIEACSCWHYGWHPTTQIDSQNDNSVDNSKFLSPDLNLTDNSREDSPDIGNGNGNGNGGNGNGNGANVTQNNDQNVAVAVNAVPAINIYNSDGSINKSAVEQIQNGGGHAVAVDGDHHPQNGTYTEIVSVMTTYCNAATTITQNGMEHTVTAAGYVTITDCPCTITHTSQPTAAPAAPAAPGAPAAPAPGAPVSPDVVPVAGNSGASANAGNGGAAAQAGDVSANAGSAAAAPPAGVDVSDNAGMGAAAPPAGVDVSDNAGMGAAAPTTGVSANAGSGTTTAPAQYTGAASVGMAVNWVLVAALGFVALL